MHQGERKHCELHVDARCENVMGWEIEVFSGVIVGERIQTGREWDKWALFQLCGWRSGVW